MSNGLIAVFSHNLTPLAQLMFFGEVKTGRCIQPVVNTVSSFGVSFIPQRLDGIKHRGLPGGINSEEYSHSRREKNRENDRTGRKMGSDSRKSAEAIGPEYAENQPKYASNAGD